MIIWAVLGLEEEECVLLLFLLFFFSCRYQSLKPENLMRSGMTDLSSEKRWFFVKKQEIHQTNENGRLSFIESNLEQ